MISVIVPVYNTSWYLAQCLRSILNQTYEDFEVIVVNDASTDNSLAVAKEFEKKDKRVKIINLAVNAGVDRARFSALEIASGEYVLFVDSDDWLSNCDVLKTMLDKMLEVKADYVEILSQRVLDSWGLIKLKASCHINGLIQQPQLYRDFYLSFFGKNLLPINIWGKLYRRSVIDKANLKPSGLTMGEDLYFNMMLFPHLKSIYIMDYVGYNYRFGGLTSRYNPRLLSDLKKLFVIKDRTIHEMNYDIAYDYLRIELKNVFRSDICQKIIFRTGGKNDILNQINEELKDPLYDEVQKVKNKPGFLDSPFVKAMAMSDADTIYDLCLESEKKQRFHRSLLKFINFMLRIF